MFSFFAPLPAVIRYGHFTVVKGNHRPGFVGRGFRRSLSPEQEVASDTGGKKSNKSGTSVA
ncbi:hypothetical protein ZHAS_00005834 [Anopheles sinensis]|uniref:Uncharacterized protein n=1 Tax=Anopheles sinensis TaxID=74873 RepID=A0A084VKR2_ANOSI|nr:hypothetical protein ZHAS_00005834 [Anopheles sinensis]